MTDIPVYGSISAIGGSWCVHYDCSRKKNSTCAHSTEGYGEFPRERFPDIPVIDFRSCKLGMISKYLDLPIEIHPEEVNPLVYKGTLAGFLDAVREIGIAVI